MHSTIRMATAGLMLILAGLFGSTAWQEWRAEQALARAAAWPVPVGLEDGDLRPWSGRTARAAGRLCVQSNMPEWRKAMTPAIAGAAAQNCTEYAETLTRYWPAEATTHLLLATLMLGRDDESGFLKSLSAARRLARHEGWQAERRLELMLAGPDPRIPAAEIASVASTQDGAEFLARTYLTNAELRPILADGLRAARPQDQSRFLRLATRMAAP